MQEGPKTQCECPLAGFCQRHGVDKSSHLHKLCQNHAGYFNMWEACRGPNQNPNDCIKPPSLSTPTPDPPLPNPGEATLPSKLQMAQNFVRASAAHLRDGMVNVSSELQKSRLDICAECPFVTKDGSRCVKCGCFLESKTRWRSSACPIGKW